MFNVGFPIRTSMLNVDDLQRRVEASAAQAGSEPSFPQLELQRLLPHLGLQHAVEPRPALVGCTRYERLWVRINKAIRRIAAHAVEPVVTQQNEFNAALLGAVEQLMQADAAVRAAISVERAARASAKDNHEQR
jgi:hypothetical protein